MSSLCVLGQSSHPTRSEGDHSLTVGRWRARCDMVLEGLRLLSWTICGRWTPREFWCQEGLMPYGRWTPPNQAPALSTRFLVPWDQT